MLPLLLLAACEQAEAPPAADADYDVPFRSDAQLATQLTDLCQLAGDRDQPLLVEFSAAWCSDCRKLHGMKQDPALAEELGRWPKIVVNVGRFDRHRDVLAALEVESIAHWEILAPSKCEAEVGEWPTLAERTLEVSSGAAQDLTSDALARWLAKLRTDYQS